MSMRRRDFVNLALAGVAARWLPACAGTEADGPPPRLDPTAGNALVAGDSVRAFAPDGRSFELAPLHHYVDAFARDGTRIARLGDPTRAPTRAVGMLNAPVAAVWDDGGARLVVLERGAERLQAFDGAGAPLGVLGSTDRGADLALDPRDRTLFVAASSAHRIEAFAPDGASRGSIGAFGTDGAGLNGPVSVAVAPDGGIHVVDVGSRTVKVFAGDR